jgi:DNA replication and repair protein RecF
LKQASKGNPVDDRELISWSDYMAEYASYINVMRREYTERLEKYVKKIINEISDGMEDIEIYYKSDVESKGLSREEVLSEYKRRLTENLEREKIVGSSLYGVHRDDLIININGNSARLFASQGQQRSIVLALKLAEGEVNREICGEYPVFLFDDVLSELDEKRKKYILDGIGERQIIITSCEKDTEGMNALKRIEVSSGLYSYS